MLRVVQRQREMARRAGARLVSSDVARLAAQEIRVLPKLTRRVDLRALRTLGALGPLVRRVGIIRLTHG
jgi:hypothetical protein